MNTTFLKYSINLLLYSFSWIYPFAQNFTTRLYTTADGLNDNYILHTYQDSYGYLWIGTTNGLNRFDGKNFKSYRLRQGLPSLFVDRIYEDRHHRLWIGTRNGIAELKGDSCYTYPVNDNQDISYVSGFLEPDSTKLWATTNKGLYELRNNQWIKIKLYPGYENSSIGRIIKTKRFLYINYDNRKLLQLSADGKGKFLLSETTDQPFYNNLHAINENIYIGTYSGLLMWQGEKWVSLFQDSLKRKYIFGSYPDRQNRWWFGTKEDGIFIAATNDTQTTYSHLPLSFNLVSHFFEDRDGNIWVAGFQGLLKVTPSYYTTISSPELSKMHNIRNSIEMPSGNIIVSGENGKLVLLKPDLAQPTSTKILSTIRLNDNNDFIDHYTFDDKQRMWFITRNSRLYRLDGNHLQDFSSVAECSKKEFRDLAYNNKTRQLIVCCDSFLLTGDETRLARAYVRNKNEFNSIPGYIYLREEDGSLLVQTNDNGSYVMTPDGKVFPLNKEFNFMIATSGPGNNIFIWTVSYGKDISKYLWTKERLPQLVETISDKNGLPGNYIMDIELDNEGKLWIASSNGVRVIQKESSGKWIPEDLEINTSDKTGAFSFTKLNNTHDGKMWINIQDKILVFDTRKISPSPVHTNTVIENVLLFGKPTNWSLLSDSLYSYSQLPVNPVLRYNQNTLSIAFNALQFTTNADVEYSYRLLPSDTTWSSPGSGNIVTLYQLSPEHYKFEVRSHIKGFDWSEPRSFSFTIRTPFWATWWFRIFVILAGAGLIIFIFRYRIRQIKTKNQMQNQLRELETKAFKLQMSPHFIHNALNSIQSLVINNKTNDASRYISKFAKLLRQMLESSDSNVTALDKELNSLALYIDLEKLRMNMDVNYSVHYDESVIASEIKIPPHILQPFIENALWHGLSQKTGEKKITLFVSKEKNWIIIEITDNGIGRNKAAKSYTFFPEGHLSKSVSIIKQRLADFNQSPATDPVSFVDLRKNGEATGTKVVVRIKAQ